MKKFFDYIFFTRPALFPPVWTILILGARAADIGEGGFPFFTKGLANFDVSLLLHMLFATILYAGVYTLNQIFDIESDRQNDKLFYLAEGMISGKSALIFTIILDVIAIGGGFMLSRRVGILFMIVLILGVLYSIPQTNFKGKPSPGYWSNAIGHGMIPFLIGWAVVDHITLESCVKSLPYVFGVGAIYLNTTLPDRDGDRAVGKTTHGVRWGIKTTMQASTALVALAVILAQMCGDYAFLIAGVVSLFFFLWALRNLDIKSIVMSTKVAILALSVFACIYFPYYVLLLVIGFLGSRLYYRMRFGLNYPSLT